jgi:hypothetical protein
MEGLNRVLPGLVSLLHFPLASLRADLRQLVASFSLGPHTITFRYGTLHWSRPPRTIYSISSVLLPSFITGLLFLTCFVDCHVRFFSYAQCCGSGMFIPDPGS